LLLCPVRDCHRELTREPKRLICGLGHAFDIARSGYVNLLQPQDRRSREPGDSAEAVAARRQLHDRGVSDPLLRAVSDLLHLSREDAILDVGCGDGYYPGNLARSSGCSAHGIDISVPAIELAARRYKECEWIVANADRFVPYGAGSFSVVLSITSRMNPAEFRRVIRDDGRLLVAVPAPDDLIELRGAGRDRVARTVTDFSPHFGLAEQRRATTVADLDVSAVENVLLSIYRPMRSRPVTARAQAEGSVMREEKKVRLTFSLDLLLFHPQPAGHGGF
jgi:23S rRNA (guanine745-N1)-methyltransferase